MSTFIESSAFERVCPVYLDDDEYAELQQFLMQHPEAGRVVAGVVGGIPQWVSGNRAGDSRGRIQTLKCTTLGVAPMRDASR